MKNFFMRHRYLIGYIFLTLMVIVALDVHHDAVINDLRKRDKHSCEQRKVLIDNQLFVLRTLDAMLVAEQHERGYPATLHKKLRQETQRRLANYSQDRSC